MVIQIVGLVLGCGSITMKWRTVWLSSLSQCSEAKALTLKARNDSFVSYYYKV